MRLAWFSPMPPVRSGIATYSGDLVAALAAEHQIDVYVDEPGVTGTARGAGLAGGHSPVVRPASSAHDFVWRHQQAPYDLIVYQVGNSSHHDYQWPYLFRYPGLVVLHDAHLHHARAARLLRERRADHYRAELAGNEPEVNPDAAELAVAGFDSHLLYACPFVRLVVAASRMTAVHSPLVRDALQHLFPETGIHHLRLGHGAPVSPAAIGARQAAARRRWGMPPEAVVFGCIGALTPDKRVPQILDAFEALLPYTPSAWLLLAGPTAEHYDVAADVARRAVQGRVVLTGYLESDEELTDSIAACDVTLNLRWPTAREVSGPWVRCLAAGRPSIVTELAHAADVPALDPRTWTALGATTSPPVSVAIDVLDEDHSLRLAMRRLAADPVLRDTLGAAARAYWARQHSQEGMFEDYRRILPLAAATPAPDARLPAHLRCDDSGVMESILDRFGVPIPWSVRKCLAPGVRRAKHLPWSKI